MTTVERKPAADTARRSPSKIILQMIVGAAFGFTAMLALDRLVGLGRLFDSMTRTSIVTITLAMLFGLIGLVALITSSSRKIFMFNQTNSEADVNDFDAMRPLLFWSAICIFLYSAILILLAMANNAGVSQPMSFWAIAGLMVGQSAISLHLWNRYDELYRDVTKDSCAVAFAVIEFGLFIWAAATICGLGVDFDPLAVIVAITAVYWTSAIWFTVKRGMT
jgi:hypothetical protein